MSDSHGEWKPVRLFDRLVKALEEAKEIAVKEKERLEQEKARKDAQ